jgi:UDP:flavonoid glycosyltransferase YjiC (YdhE family)
MVGHENECACRGGAVIEAVSARRRVLFIAEAVTLAHVARPLALARMLDPARYEVIFACDTRYNRLLETSQLKLLPLHSISSEQFLKSLASGSRLYDKATLDGYVRADMELIKASQPDIIVGDFRLSLSVSARLAGRPYITISNAYWSPYARPHFTVPELPMLKFTGVKLGQRMFGWVRPIAFRYHALPLNQLRKQYGLPPLGFDLRRIYTDADYTLYADIPQLVPTYDLPDTHRYVGPTLWSPAGPLPDWWAMLPDDKPIVYVTLGSSGHGRLLPTVLNALANMPVTVIAACAGRNLPADVPPNAYVADYLPGEEAAKRAALVISNGGSQTSYQALAHGKPVIGIPANLDQYLNMHYILAANAGRVIRTGSLVPDAIAESVREVLQNARYAEEARTLMQFIVNYPSRNSVEAVLESAGTRGTERDG